MWYWTLEVSNTRHKKYWMSIVQRVLSRKDKLPLSKKKIRRFIQKNTYLVVVRTVSWLMKLDHVLIALDITLGCKYEWRALRLRLILWSVGSCFQMLALYRLWISTSRTWYYSTYSLNPDTTISLVWNELISMVLILSTTGSPTKCNLLLLKWDESCQRNITCGRACADPCQKLRRFRIPKRYDVPSIVCRWTNPNQIT